jgi:hypothetical protein
VERRSMLELRRSSHRVPPQHVESGPRNILIRTFMRAWQRHLKLARKRLYALDVHHGTLRSNLLGVGPLLFRRAIVRVWGGAAQHQESLCSGESGVG